jgi:mannose-6-phosphate isomerase-like protein (cupin superfamily)
MQPKTILKPWGYEQHFPDQTNTKDKTISYRQKTLVVYPKEAISLQYHFNRDEIWKVLFGRGIIIIDKQEYLAYPGTKWHVGRKQLHRLIASKEEAIVVEEESFGDVWNENDIVRIEDKYRRLAS